MRTRVAQAAAAQLLDRAAGLEADVVAQEEAAAEIAGGEPDFGDADFFRRRDGGATLVSRVLRPTAAAEPQFACRRSGRAIPAPVACSKSVTSTGAMPRCLAWRTMARARGWFEWRSSEAARRRTSSSRPGGKLSTVSTRRSPVVSVPVLSMATTLHLGELLDRRAAAEENAAPRAPGDGGEDGGRNGQHERARRGDDEERHGVVKGAHVAGHGDERADGRARATRRRT